MSKVMLFTQGHRVICPNHGSTGLSPEQYQSQMLRPDSFWKCPICMEVGVWDDDAFEAYCDWLRSVN